ncbi:dihydrofolate reductase family protein [Oscillibacter sp. MSJ-2]|uniref:Dihydrofolate reductase family protein n=1 Tax=Dysosmobacter acutus TaxID=2841504 RepID=A0ABS6F767_9FIRM|nr:dihydrofolate reductase family protein [Dysosmobacter acutus]MBU5626121.1 dihydrofolate reductase family protein [Dysosmobacter acutus]
MNRPYTICYMMTSVDGRIDCDMVGRLAGVEDYYPLLDKLGLQSAVSGKRTAQLELAEPGAFAPRNSAPLGKDVVSKKTDSSSGYTIVVDTKGTLLWKHDSQYAQPHILITSQQVSQEYLSYLDEKNISYIVAGDAKIDLAAASDVLKETFGIERMGVVGGPAINTAFLDAGLLDEVIVLSGAGIDGRASFPPVFHREGEGPSEPTPLKLIEAKTYDSGAVFIRYRIK